MWAICDVAMGLILTRLTFYDMREAPAEARIPSMYFQAQPEDFHNTRYYIPDDMYNLTDRSGRSAMPSGSKACPPGPKTKPSSASSSTSASCPPSSSSTLTIAVSSSSATSATERNKLKAKNIRQLAHDDDEQNGQDENEDTGPPPSKRLHKAVDGASV
uniref:Uncharacterized protein n=1 Tax=Anopheles maculatus TaxID=74869 RepID=A0A182S650_9DIPT